MIEISIAGLISLMGIPSAVTGFCFWLIQRKIKKHDKDRETQEQARKELELLVVQSTSAAIALSEATARAVQRIPDAHCNGDMHSALEYAAKVKHEQKEFLTKHGISAIFD